MSIVLVNLGQDPNDGAGDDLRTAFEKSNANFDELDKTRVIFAQNLGTGAPIFLDKVGNDLRFRSIKSGNSNAAISYNSDPGQEEIIISVEDSINELVEDLNPRLGGDMNINGFDIIGNGNISISGNVTANEVIGTFNGAFNGSFNGTLVGNVLVTDGSIIVQAVDSSTNNFNPVSVNGLTFVGGNLFEPSLNTLSTAIGDGLLIFSDNQLILNSNNGVLIDTDLTVTNGIVGTISSISNHNLSGLGDVAETQPNQGQALVWNGTQWAPGNVATNGQELNTFDLGNFRRVFTNPLVYLLDRVGIDFGTFTAPSDFTIDLETF